MSSRADAPTAAARVTAHGGLLDAELAALGIARDDVLDLSVNVNPYGPTDAMRTAVRDARIDRYPDPTSSAARAVIAAHVGVEPAAIALGNGAVDLLWTLVRAVLQPGSTVAVVEPTFSELPRAARAADMRVVAWRASTERHFAVDLDEVAALVLGEAPQLLYLCSPGNPTGAAIPADDVARLAERFPRLVVVVDQAFLSLSTRFGDAARAMPPNVVRVRSLTKDHAIPGLRVGYLIAAPEIVARVEAARPPWTTSALAQAATVAALADRAFVDASRERLLADRARLEGSLRALGLAPLPSSTLYVLVPVEGATALRHRMLARHRVLVRDCSSFGLPHFIRICARPERDEARLIEALRQELSP